ncbi:uncharacterized protein [Ambystoma mexicanum]|uniref:uncharacterized protein n=1 Tax=Ambystoma mexicanum TaxID=8296 RepID=UPI0037E991DD
MPGGLPVLQLLDICAMVYIDDILIYSATEEEPVHHVRAVLEKLCQHHLYAKLEKCFFHVITVEFLDFILPPHGFQMDNRKVEAILNWPSPTSLKTVQGFLGFANFYRQIIPGLSDIAHPITSLLGKRKTFKWSPEAERAFKQCKTQFTMAPILKHPNPELPKQMPSVSRWERCCLKGTRRTPTYIPWHYWPSRSGATIC